MKRQLTVGGLLAFFLAVMNLSDLLVPTPWMAATLYLLSALAVAGLLVFILREEM